MSLTIETDLKDIFTRIDQRFERMEQNLTDIKLGQSEIKGQIGTLDQKLTGQISTLDQKLTGQIGTLDEKLTGQIGTLDNKVQTTNDKIDKLEKTVDKISVDVSASKQDISDLKGVKSLIVPAFVAIFASLLTFLLRDINLP